MGGIGILDSTWEMRTLVLREFKLHAHSHTGDNNALGFSNRRAGSMSSGSPLHGPFQLLLFVPSPANGPACSRASLLLLIDIIILYTLPGTMMSGPSMGIVLVILPATLPGGRVTLGFTVEEFEEQRGLEVCPKSHSWFRTDLGSNPWFV